MSPWQAEPVGRNDLGHHSDATLGYKSVLISISSSDLGGYAAEHDIELARRIEAAAGAHGAA